METRCIVTRPLFVKCWTNNCRMLRWRARPQPRRRAMARFAEGSEKTRMQWLKPVVSCHTFAKNALLVAPLCIAPSSASAELLATTV